jgi:eukaryotic-like serine/threonine-protein kinase
MTERAQAVGKPFEVVLGRCLVPKPSQRFESFGELREELETVFRQRTGRVVELPEKYVWAVPFWINRGYSLHSLGRYDEAVACFNKALEISPDDAPAHGSLGIALQAKGDLDGAIAEYRTALRLQPDDAATHSNLGTALRDKADLDEAIAEYRRAIRLQPELALPHYNLGNALRDKAATLSFSYLRDLEEAIAEYRVALRLQPDFTGARRNLEIALITLRTLSGRT